MSAGPPTTVHTGVSQEPHRGGVVLALGILSIVFGSGCGIGLILGIIGWVMANSDLERMRAGTMSREGEGLTQAGKICSIVGVCLSGLVFAFGLIWVVFIGFAMFAGAVAGP